MSGLQVRISLLCILLIKTLFLSSQNNGKYYYIRVIDEETGRGVPLVELKTTNHLSSYTDNSGIIAFYEPGLMNQEVFFHIKSHGYEYPMDGFEYRGTTLLTVPGNSTVIKIKRINIAERLYRITGEGLYNNSLLMGIKVPLRKALLNSKVTGQDTFIETYYRGKIYWFWGDTDKPSYPLGNFSTSGATSDLPRNGGLDPDKGVDLVYFTDETGFSKKMCPLEGPGPVWMHWLATLADSTGRERLVGSFTRIKTLSEYYERGLAVFNDSSEVFEPVVRFDLSSPFFPDGQSFRVTADGLEYIYFDVSNRYPMRVRADWAHIKDLSSYESYTCLEEGSKYDTNSIRIERSESGLPVYGWKRNTDPLNLEREKLLLRKGKLKSGETWFRLRDILTGDHIQSTSGSVFWNEYRKKWVMVYEQVFGSSFLGEVWYAEGDTPAGPWVYSTKVVTHDNYSFYNVGQHPLFDQQNGRLIYFEGTYTNSFTSNPVPTPRYNYNQVMYRLDLNDHRLYLPSPVYRISNNKRGSRYLMRDETDTLKLWEQIEEIPFFALPRDRSIEGSLPIYRVREKGKERLITKSPGLKAEPLFWGFPASQSVGADGNSSLPPSMVYLYEFTDNDGFFYYSIKSDLPGLRRSENPVCLVWENPSSVLTLDFKAKAVKAVR